MGEPAPNRWRAFLASWTLPLAMLVAISAGSAAGAWWGPGAKALQPLGDLFLNLMFTLVVPLVFCSIASAVSNMSSLRRLGKIAARMLAIFVVTGLFAAVLALVLVVLFPPGRGACVPLPPADAAAAPSLGAQIVAAVSVPDFVDLLSRRNMLALIAFAGLFGLCVVLVGEKAKPVGRALSLVSDVVLRMTTLVMWYAPIGLGALFASLVGEHGAEILGGYARAVAVYYPVSLVYFGGCFTLYAWLAAGRPGVGAFWRAIPTAAVTAFGSGSSMASIPANLAASRRIGVPRDIRELVVPVGATVHMDGSSISAVVKIAFLFAVFGVPFTGFDVWAVALGVALLSGVVMSGVPGGGFIGEMLIVTLYGFPTEALPLLAVLGTLVDPPATMVNSTGDTVTGMLLARWIDGRDWFKRARESKSGPTTPSAG
ncbi:MAG: dicarboxylate/amino acid:cation symporter [Deltaproteobacteria bacterium]|nr:dicarboxylate/amino acid:cation symporter [Deltaproteobacteria bacterium]